MGAGPCLHSIPTVCPLEVMKLGACADTVNFYLQAKPLQILVPAGVGVGVDPTSPRTLGNDAVCFWLPMTPPLHW